MSIGEFVGQTLPYLTKTIFQTSIFWLPLVLGYLLIHLHFYYIRSRFIGRMKFVLLEVKIPKEIEKTPQAMEIALGAMHQTWDGDNVLIGEWILGQLRTWFSLELVSINGEVHFYIWTNRFFKNIVEAQVYAQYPEVEIVEVEDYTRQVPFGLPGSDWDLWGCDFKLDKEDAYPIKTYIDYGLDKLEVEEGAKSDPLTATLELLGSIGPNEQIWIQILVMANKKRFRKKGSLFKKVGWKNNSEELIEELMKRGKYAKQLKQPAGAIGEEVTRPMLTILSPGERKVVENIERNLGKLGFDCGIRALYFAKKDKMNRSNIPGIIGALRQYSSADMNGFKVRRRTAFMYPWQDLLRRRTARLKAAFFDAYRRRSYFYPPYVRTPFVLSSEELATIYHFPGRVAATPTFPKIESKRGEPPVNLPV